MQYANVPMEIKALDESGTFDGYASVFGNVDLGGDVIERGAFKEFVKNDDGQVVVLWQHRTDAPIGVAEVSQDDVGLRFKGKLVLEDPNARRAQAHMKAKSVRGMSIGYDVLENGARMMSSGVRALTGLKLWEISLVTFGMNPLAGVAGVKYMQQITNIREYENFLREVGGYSKEQAKILAKSFRDLPGQREADAQADDDGLAVDLELLAFCKSIAAPSK
jgi:HK97 family phage prohead protease